MPSGEHESPLELIHEDPDLVVWLLTELFKLNVPPFADARPHTTEVRELVPHTYHADGVVTLHDEGGRAVFGAVVEVQRSREEGKLRTWKQYLAALEASIHTPVALVVLCSRSLPAWYSVRIRSDPGSLQLHPHWVTPEQVPLPRHPAEARAQPAAAVLGTLLHAGEPGIDQAFPALAGAIQGLTGDKALLYYDVVMAGLPDEARKRWEDYMKTSPEGQTYRSELFRRIEAKSEAKSVLAVLDARGLTVSGAERERVLATTDLHVLDAWLRRAATADSVEEALSPS